MASTLNEAKRFYYALKKPEASLGVVICPANILILRVAHKGIYT